MRTFAVCAWLACAAACAGCDSRPPLPIDEVEVRLVAQETSWKASYLRVPTPRGRTDVPTGREVHVPLGADVRLALTSRDYISDFRLPGFGLRDFAAPNLPTEFRFRASRAGRYDVRGDEMCGRPHDDRARGTLVVEDAVSYRAWMRRQTNELTP